MVLQACSKRIGKCLQMMLHCLQAELKMTMRPCCQAPVVSVSWLVVVAQEMLPLAVRQTCSEPRQSVAPPTGSVHLMALLVAGSMV